MRSIIVATIIAAISSLSVYAGSIVNQVYFRAKLDDKIPVEISIAVDAHHIAAGYIRYTAVSKTPILLAGRWEEDPLPETGGYYQHLDLLEYDDSGLITGRLVINLDESAVTKGRFHFSEGFWIHPQKAWDEDLEITDVTMLSDLPDYFDTTLLDPATRADIGDHYEYGVFNADNSAWRGGQIELFYNEKGKQVMEVFNTSPWLDSIANLSNVVQTGESEGAVQFNDVNECHYSFEARYYKRFVALTTTGGADKINKCFKGWQGVEGIYLKTEADPGPDEE